MSGIHADRQGQPAGLYIHIPFCVSRCGYCSFTSYPCGGAPPSDYLAAVRQQAEQMAAHPLIRDRSFGTIFVGGGTPTVYQGKELAQLVQSCLALFNFAKNPEVTVEANPNSVDPDKLLALREAGVNRLSIGVQAFSDRLLQKIDRSHTVAEALHAVTTARQAGFENLSLDLIYGLPEQDLGDWQETLALALAQKPEHLSLYGLSVEEGTPFARLAERGELPLPDEDAVLQMEHFAYEQLARAGFDRYEISNFATPGGRSRHNENYWRNGNYLGLGAAAVSCFDHLRWRQVAGPDTFVKLVNEGQSPLLEVECLPPAAAFRETVIMALRMLDGIAVAELQERFGVSPQEYYGPIFVRLQEQGLLEVEDGFLRLTAKALPFANQVLAELV
ncbi:radical SAM family heme chaperone HemW [Thermodesulfobacteriota bacterium]